jgi:hypothetical protein
MILKEEKGSYSSINTKSLFFIKSDKELSKIWAEHCRLMLPPLEKPKIDFTKNYMIMTVLGTRESLGYKVEIKPVKIENDNFFVRIIETVPQNSCLTGAAMVSPWHYIVVTKFKGDLLEI